MHALDGPTFMAMAFRLPMYPGVLQARLRLQDTQPTPTPNASTGRQLAAVTGELTEDEVEALRNQARIHANRGALRPGEQPQHVSLEQLTRLSK